MTKLNLFLLLLLLCFHCDLLVQTAAAQPNPEPSTNDFIKAECEATRYPALCIQSLSNYTATIQQSHLLLAQTAISVSLSRAQSAGSFVSRLAKMKSMKPTEYGAVKDCVDNMGATVDQLRRSKKELGGMGRPTADQDFSWHVNNVQTWVSAALTNENTCLDGFGSSAVNGNVKAAIRRRVVDCAQVTSNALALVNRFAERHKH